MHEVTVHHLYVSEMMKWEGIKLKVRDTDHTLQQNKASTHTYDHYLEKVILCPGGERWQYYYTASSSIVEHT